MKGNKKGFTLIELLAVIVILAIIALIAVPVILNILDKSNKSAFKDTAYGIISAGELYFAEQQLELNGMLEDKEFTLPSVELDIKGQVPEGKMIVNTEGKVALMVKNGRYCVTKDFDDMDITLTEDVENCELPVKVIQIGDEVYYNPVENAICENYTEANSAIGVKTGCMKWYVYKKEGNNVGLILDHNTTAQVAWITSAKYKEIVPTARSAKNDKGPATLMEQLATDTTGWAVEADIPDAQDILKLVPWYQSIEDKSTWESQYVELIDTLWDAMEENVPDTDGNNFALWNAQTEYIINNYSNIISPSYMYENIAETCEEVTDENGQPDVECVTYGYWLKTPITSKATSAWYVSDIGFIDYNTVVTPDFSGLRPVITLSKSIIS